MSKDSTAVSAPANPSTEGVGNLSSEGVYHELLRRSTPEPGATEETPEQAETTETVETPDVAAEATEETEEADTEPTEEAAESEDKEQQTDEEETPKEDVPSKLPDKVQQAFNKRIGKEVAKRKAAEEKATAAEKQAAEYKARLEQFAQQQAQSVPVVVDDTLADVNTPEELERKRQLASTTLQTVEDALDDNETDEEGMYEVGGRKLSRQQLKDIRSMARRDLAAIPQRQQFLTEKQKAMEAAAKDFPWMNDATSEMYQEAVMQYKRHPYLAKDPWSLYNVGLAIEGKAALKARQEAAKKPAEVKKPTPTPPKVTVTPAVVPAKKPAAQVKDQKAAQRRAEVTKGNMTSDDVYSLLLQNEKSKAGES